MASKPSPASSIVEGSGTAANWYTALRTAKSLGPTLCNVSAALPKPVAVKWMSCPEFVSPPNSPVPLNGAVKTTWNGRFEGSGSVNVV